MISKNWRRGLFRIWIAASVVWLVGAGAVMQKEIRQDVSAVIASAQYSYKKGSDPSVFEVIDRDYAARERLKSVASIVLLPPILVLVLGWTGIWTWLWIVRGFRS